MKYDWQAIIPDMENPLPLDEQAKLIAKVLRSDDELSSTFRGMLAGMLSGEKNGTPFVLRLAHKDRGRPARVDWRLGFDMERMVDREKLSVDEAVYQAQRRFGRRGTSRRKCLSALSEARQWTIGSDVLAAARVQTTT